MNRWLLLLLVWLPWLAHAHIGTPYVIFEGKAGTYPVRVIIRQPDVVPGLAEISVRVLAGSPTRVTVLPLHASTDRSGSPRPDIATLVPGDAHLYSAALWFMIRGAYGVEVSLEGEGGGTLMIPVNSIATVQKPLPLWLGWVLSGLGLLLVAGLIAIVAGAVRESTLVAGALVSVRRRFFAWLGGGVATLIALGAMMGGVQWWNSEDQKHQNRVLFHPLLHTVAITNLAGTPTLELMLTDPRLGDISPSPSSRRLPEAARRPLGSPSRQLALVPDHGKLVHLFLIGESIGDVIPPFAHLHPIAEGGNRFFATLPALPAGRYRVFADLTHEAGLTETLTNAIELPARIPSWTASDPDDSFRLESAANHDGLTMKLDCPILRVDEPAALRVLVRTSDGEPARLQPYLRMLGHAVVERADGSVFAHVHPAGTLSLTAARRFAEQAGGTAAGQAMDVNCGDLAAVPSSVVEALSRGGEVSFPFVFPQPGRYRVWAQVRVKGVIHTGDFAVTVEDKRSRRP